MGILDSDLTPPLEISRQIDICCQDFEQAWKNGGTPRIEDFIDRVSPLGRSRLLRELLILELGYLSSARGGAPSDAEVCASHPTLMPQIGEALKKLKQVGSASDVADTVASEQQLKPPAKSTARDVDATVDHENKSTGSRALHIRCPHCTNPVELLSDAPLEDITCRTCGSTFSLVDHDDRTREAPKLRRIGRFDLVARLGIGGFGTVWKAHDTELDRTVAVKIPRKGQLARAEMEQFFREARSAAQLRHPNIVPVHEVGRDADTIFIVSDFIRGVSLADWLTGATPNCREIAELMATVADALQHAHEKGVIHRDLKPSNILLDESGQPHVMDFGLAKREVGEISVTIDGNVLGTPAYMSPEQAAGEGHWTDRRTDVYSLGVILYRMLTGELPFRGNAQMQIHRRLTDDPPDPRTLNRHLPRDLCTICLKCLERDPNRRFSTAKELADELGRYLRQEPILSRPVSRIERALRWAKRKPALATIAGLIAFLAIVGPATALVMTGLYQRQTRLLKENDNLIDRYRNDIDGKNKKIVDLTGQIKAWEGKVNPWEFWLWPPKPDQPPRRMLVAAALDGATAALAKPLSEGKFDREQTVRGYLGLAALAEADAKQTVARNYYQLALTKLNEHRKQNPGQPQYARAAAECYERMAKLDRDIDLKAAASHLESARTIYQQLAAEHLTDPASQIDSLEAELNSAFGKEPEIKARHLDRVTEIKHELESKSPTSPDAVYRLACYLTKSEPILLQRDGGNSPPASNAKPAPATH